MTNYEELVKALRCGEYRPECGSSDCPYWSGLGCMDGQLVEDAAASIEELQADVEKWTFNATLEQSKAIANFESYCKLKAQLPKRGEWIDGENFEDPFLGKFRCSVCGHAVQAIEYNYEQKTVRFTCGKSNYCPNCGAKMEVQDEGTGSL